MNENGFIIKKDNNYYNEKLGLILEDLHDENVLTKDGLLYFIDTVFYLSDKMDKGGKMEPTHTLEEFNNLIEVLEDALKNAIRDNEGSERIARLNELVDRVKKQRDDACFNKGGVIEKEIKQGDFILPAGHKPFLKVGNGGSSCATCKFVAKNGNGNICTNKYYQEWEGTDKLPNDINNYCSDWFEPKE